MCIVRNCSILVKQMTDATTSAPNKNVVTVLEALSDPVRLEIVRQVAAQGENGELSCGQLEVPVSKSTCSHHLKTLNGAGVTAEREEGTRKYIRLRRDELERSYPGLIDSVLRAVGAG
jgi:DNA-binding transcriptional ArsR family regulator